MLESHGRLNLEPGPTEEVRDHLAELVADAKAAATAEADYWRARLDYSIVEGERAAMFGGVALILVNGAVIALIVGLIQMLIPAVGPGFATLIVTLAFLLIAAGFGYLALQAVRNLSFSRKKSGS